VLKIVAVNELCVFDHELLRTSHAVLGELRVGLAAPYDLLSFAECIVRSGSGLLACLQFIDCRVAAAPARNILYLSNLLKRSSQICLFAILQPVRLETNLGSHKESSACTRSASFRDCRSHECPSYWLNASALPRAIIVRLFV
jgi:hypothetical protein